MIRAPKKPIPAALTNIAPIENIREVTVDRFDFVSIGEKSFLKDDPLAARGKAAVIFGGKDGGEWAVQAHLDRFYDAGHPDQEWDLYASVRVESSLVSGDAFDFGYYASTPGIGSARTVRFDLQPGNADAVATKGYNLHKLPTTKQGDGLSYVWFSSKQRDGVGDIYIDRIFLVKK